MINLLFTVILSILPERINKCHYELKFISNKNEVINVYPSDILNIDSNTKRLELTESKAAQLDKYNFTGGKVLILKCGNVTDTVFFFEAYSSHILPKKYFLIKDGKLLWEKNNKLIFVGFNLPLILR